MAPPVAIQCLAILALVGRNLAGPTLTCGNGAGAHCNNNWNDLNCGSTDGACCHDDFNVWCCPHGFKCSGIYQDPGDNTHCMTDDKVSSSCICDQAEYEIVAMDPVGETQIDNLWDDSLTACCQYPTEKCGWSTTITKTNSQEVTWSDAEEVGYHMTWNVVVGPALELSEIGFETQDTFTYGQTTDTSTEQAYTNACICDSSDCTGPFTELTYKLKLVHSTQPVQITATKCGVTKKLPGTVRTTQWQGGSECDINQNLSSCPTTTEEDVELPQTDNAPSNVHCCGALWIFSLLCCTIASHEDS